MVKQKLLACPFCGNEAAVDFGTMETYIAKKEKRDPLGPYEVHCTNSICHVSTGWNNNSAKIWNSRV